MLTNHSTTMHNADRLKFLYKIIEKDFQQISTVLLFGAPFKRFKPHIQPAQLYPTLPMVSLCSLHFYEDGHGNCQTSRTS